MHFMLFILIHLSLWPFTVNHVSAAVSLLSQTSVPLRIHYRPGCAQGVSRCVGACAASVGGDCWECFDPDHDPTTGELSDAAMSRCSYALDLGNAR